MFLKAGVEMHFELKIIPSKTVEIIMKMTTELRLLMTLRKKASENFVGNGENAGNHHFLLFPPCFLPYHRQQSLFHYRLNNLLYVSAFNFVQSNTLSFGTELMNIISH